MPLDLADQSIISLGAAILWCAAGIVIVSAVMVWLFATLRAASRSRGARNAGWRSSSRREPAKDLGPFPL